VANSESPESRLFQKNRIEARHGTELSFTWMGKPSTTLEIELPKPRFNQSIGESRSGQAKSFLGAENVRTAWTLLIGVVAGAE